MRTQGIRRGTHATVAPAPPGPGLQEAEAALVRLLARQAAAEHIQALRVRMVRD